MLTHYGHWAANMQRQILACLIFVCIIRRTSSAATAFEVAPGETNLVQLQDGGSSILKLEYESTDTATYTFAASLDTGTTFDTSSATKDPNLKTIEYTLLPSFVTDGYGTYLLNLTLDDGTSGIDVYKEVVLFYEEAIAGFQISRTNTFLGLNELSTFTVTFTSGSNVETEWFLDTNDTCLKQHTGTGARTENVDFTFTVGGTHNVTAVAANTVSRTFHSLIVEAIYHINGITVSTPTTAVGVNQNYNITVKLGSSANLPQGTIKVNVSYGDGAVETIDLSTQITAMQGAGYMIQHVYSSQGNYSISCVFYNEIGSSTIAKEAYIWEALSVTLSSAFAFEEGTALVFDFVSTPASNFYFSVSFGDGALHEVTDADLSQPYSFSSFNHSYTGVGVYNVTMTAWNPFYVSVCSYEVQALIPLLPDNTTLTPTTDEIPFPDGVVNFTLIMTADKNTPTDVLCTFDYGDSTVETNVSTVLAYNVAVVKPHTYTAGGTYTVTFNCLNLISTLQKTATIIVRAFTVNDFGLQVDNPVPMNMTLDGSLPKAVPAEVTFTLTLFACSRMPPNITATWNFGDGASTTQPQSTFEKQHTYSIRETVLFNVVIQDSIGTTKTISTSLALGISKLTTDVQQAAVGTGTFTLTATGLSGSTTFDFDVDSTTDTPAQSSGTCTISYAKYGIYFPKVTATNGSVTEIVYLAEPLKVDYDMTGNLAIDFSNTTVLLPPGHVTITITSATMSFPMVTCSLISGDLIDTHTHVKSHNITPSSPLVFPYTYQTLGNHSLSANCSNFLTTIPIFNSVYAQNPCFTKNGIFDRQYSDISNPMKVYTSQDVYVSSRMGVTCIDKTALFQWEIFSNYTSEEGKVHYPYTNPISPSKGTMLFPRAKIPEGVYLVTLNVSLDGTWIKEPIVINFVKPAPYAFIAGGSKKVARKMDEVIDINALDESYDAEGGFGVNGNLIFSWECKTVNTSDLTQLETIVNSGFVDSITAIGDCVLDAGTVSGKKKLNITLSPGYVVTVTVSDGKKASKFSQMLSILEGNPPNMQLKCIINCKEKLAVTSRMNVLAECMDCTASEFPTYRWTLEENVNGVWTPIDLSLKTANGISNQALVLNENTLKTGTQYMIKLTTTISTRSGPSVVIMDIVTNYPPYNGACTVTPTEGKALVDKFSVECSNWVDEGAYKERNLTRDLANGEPLTYLYETLTRRNRATGNETIKTEVFRGGESTITDVPFQLGDPLFDYNVTVQVQVFDRIGDKTLFEINIKVKPMDNVTPNSSSDTTAITSLFNSFESAYNITNAGGNDMGVVRLVSAVSSYIVDAGGDTQGTSEEDILSGATSVTDSATSEVTKLYQEKTTEMTNILLNTVSSDTSTPKQFSATDVQQISSALETVMKPSYITSDSAKTSTTIVQSMMTSVLNTSLSKPFPVENLESIQSSVQSTVKVLDSILSSMLPTTVMDVSAAITLDSIIAELTEKQEQETAQADLLGTTVTPMTTADIQTKAELLFQIRIKEQEKQKEQAIFAEENVAKIEAALVDMKKILLLTQEVGEGSKTLSQGGLDVSTEKITIESLLNRTEGIVKGIQLDFDLGDNTTADGNQTILDVEVVVHSKNPYMYGTDASSITSPVTSVVVSGDIRPDVKFKNQGSIHYQDYVPKSDPNDPDKIVYITFKMANEGDSVIAYIKPHNMDPTDRSTWSLYTLYLGDLTYPKSSSFDFSKPLSIADWTDYGFKVFIKAGLCNKGTCFFGLKPMQMADYSSFAVRTRRKRQAISTTPATVDNSTLLVVDANFSVVIATTGCRAWDVKSKAWVSNGCVVLPMSTINETVCRCPSPSTGNIFASSFYVPPNMIDFNTVWSKFDPANAAVYGTVIALFVVYAIAAILLRREDNKDTERWAIHFLVDSDSTDEYFYMITVHTGLRRGAGTKSVVNFVVAGDEDDSGVRILSDGIKEGFDTGSVRKYFMGTKTALGGLTYIRIWHDNSGSGENQNWYLNKVVVDDPQTNIRYVFLCDRWLALDQDDGQVERVVPVCGRDNLVAFNTLFAQHAQFNLTENHLWLSLMIRPERSPFSRVQRLSCLMALLFLTMIANAMFFKSSSEDQTASGNEVQIGFLRFSLSTVYVSFIGIALTTPPIMFVTMVFKKCRPKVELNHKNKETAEKLDKKVKGNMKKELDKRAFNGEDFFTKDHLPLPYWMAYVAWVVVWLAVITSAFFLILYSMEWGKPKAEEWLSSFFFSFFESLICVDPLKVIIIAVLLAMLFKQPADGETPGMDLKKLKSAASQYNSGSERSYMAFVNGIFNKSEPPPQSDLEKLREKRKQELKAQEALMNLIFYAIFMFIIYSISYIERDHRSFFMKTNVENYLVGDGYGQFGFKGINKTKDFYTWMQKTFIPTYYPETQYSGASLGEQDKRYFGDLSSIRVGPGRLRQVRMGKGECIYHKLTWPYYCVNYYDMYQEDEKEYCLGWKTYNATACDTVQYKSLFQTFEAWRYTKSIDIWGLPLTGEYNTYGGGGYILKLPKTRLQAQNLMSELNTFNWIDRGTRAILVEFTLYNPNANLFTYVTYITEVTEMGGSFTWTETNPFRPMVSLNAMGTFAIICYCIYVLYQLVLTYETIKGLKKDGCCKYFRVVWNSVDTVCLFLGYAAISIFIIRLINTNQAMDQFYDDKLTGANSFINFFHIVVWDMLFNIIMAILVFIASLRILRILGYNQKLTEIITVVSNAATEIIGFGFVFGIVFGAYVIFGYLIFGRTLYEYRSIFTSWGTLTNALIGKNSLDTMMMAAPQLAQFYYFTYVFCVLFTLITMFAAILNKSITDVRGDANKKGDMFGIVDMLTKSFKDLVGIAYKSEAPASKRAEAKKKYMQSIGLNPKFDTQNILRLVRTTLDEVNDGQGFKRVNTSKGDINSEDLLMKRLDPQTPNRSNSRISGAETPRDISLVFNDAKC